MSDTTRTRDSAPRPNPDTLDGMGQQLKALAKAGLLVSEIIKRQKEHTDLGLLLEFAASSSEPQEQARKLIDLVVQACDHLGPGLLGESARKLYGTGQG